ncbi:MAG TPA: hypothetical protein VFJ58_22650 [Armatimonadota bacterium]|nr:hypothetical protein [Armatimonadota bacterium]
MLPGGWLNTGKPDKICSNGFAMFLGRRGAAEWLPGEDCSILEGPAAMFENKATAIKVGATQSDRAAYHRLNEARSRGATLIGAAAPGSQGTVRIWTPDRWRLWFCGLRGELGWLLGIALFFLALPVYVLMLVSEAGLEAMLFAAAMPLLAYLALTLPGVLRPCYITTDDAGLGVTSWNRSLALHWSEIQFVERGLWGAYEVVAFPGRYESAPIRAGVHLAGYSRETRRAILALIAEKAELHPHLHYPGLLVCSESKLAGQSSLSRRGAI